MTFPSSWVAAFAIRYKHSRGSRVLETSRAKPLSVDQLTVGPARGGKRRKRNGISRKSNACRKGETGGSSRTAERRFRNAEIKTSFYDAVVVTTRKFILAIRRDSLCLTLQINCAFDNIQSIEKLTVRMTIQPKEVCERLDIREEISIYS